MSKIGGSSKIQRLLKESSLLCHDGKFTEAKKIYRDLLKLIPNHPEVLGNLGTIELQEGNTETGVSYLTQALKKNPTEIKYIINLANAYISLNKFKEALEYLESAEKISPNLLTILYNKARALRGLNEFDSAITNLNKCLTLDPFNYLVLCDLALLFTQKEDFLMAEDFYNKAIEINPENYLTYYNRGGVLENLNQFQNALDDYNFLLKKNPSFEPALFNKARALLNLKNFKAALDQINYMIVNDRSNPNYLLARAIIFEEMDEHDLAIQDYDQICSINPNSPSADEAREKKGYINLELNKFQEGWKLYELRWRTRDKLSTSKPELINFNITNKKVFIWAEQGIGDQIMWSSLFIEALKTQNSFVVSIDPRLIDLFDRSFSWASNVKFISSNDCIPDTEYDFHLPMGGLGKFFRNSILDFDAHPIAYLKADEKKINFLNEKLKKNHVKVCGVSWKSSNAAYLADKSLFLDQLKPILLKPTTAYVNLQYGETSEEIKKIFEKYKIDIQSVNEVDNYNDIDGLAALISACDYIVTTSNVTAHIAGALNKKTFLLLPCGIAKIWYWGISSEHSLWYPSIEIFRKTISDSWEDSIEKLANKLELTYG
jgi:tetratricopeptide (TPR) repeat protein